MTATAMARAVGLAALVVCPGCVLGLGKSLHQYSMLDVEKTSGKTSRPVNAEAPDKVILGFVMQTDYVDKARDDLLSACANGELVNVRIRHSTDLGFFAFRRKLRMEADCLEGTAAPARP